MTKHALLASVFAFAALAAPASADFAGLYVGGHVGGIWGDIETTTITDSTGGSKATMPIFRRAA